MQGRRCTNEIYRVLSCLIGLCCFVGGLMMSSCLVQLMVLMFILLISPYLELDQKQA